MDTCWVLDVMCKRLYFLNIFCAQCLVYLSYLLTVLKIKLYMIIIEIDAHLTRYKKVQINTVLTN